MSSCTAAESGEFVGEVSAGGTLEGLAGGSGGVDRRAGVVRPKDCAAHLLATVLGRFSLHALAIDGVPAGHAARQLPTWLSRLL